MQFLVFVQPYNQSSLTLYQIEIVPVLIIDQNVHGNLYTEMCVSKPYIALNSAIYISLKHQELHTYKHIGSDFYCEELFDVKHKAKYSCETALFCDLSEEIIIKYYNINTSVKTAVKLL